MKIKKPRILHLLEVSLPILAGYTIRTHNILQEQQKYVYPLALIDPKIMRNKNPYVKNGVPYYKFPKYIKTIVFSVSFLTNYKFSLYPLQYLSN